MGFQAIAKASAFSTVPLQRSEVSQTPLQKKKMNWRDVMQVEKSRRPSTSARMAKAILGNPKGYFLRKPPKVNPWIAFYAQKIAYTFQFPQIEMPPIND